MKQKNHYFHIPALIVLGILAILQIYYLITDWQLFFDIASYGSISLSLIVNCLLSPPAILIAYVLAGAGIVRNKGGVLIPLSFAIMAVISVFSLLAFLLNTLINIFDTNLFYDFIVFIENILTIITYLAAAFLAVTTQIKKYDKYKTTAKKIWFVPAVCYGLCIILEIAETVFFHHFWYTAILYFLNILVVESMLVFVPLWCVHPHTRFLPAFGGENDNIIDMSGAYSQNAQGAYMQKLGEYNASNGLADEVTEAKLFAQAVELQLLNVPMSAVFCPLAEMSVSQNAYGGYVVSGYVDSQNAFGTYMRSEFAFNVSRNNGVWICTDRFYAS